MAAGTELLRIDVVEKATWEKVLALADQSTQLLALLNNAVLPSVGESDEGKVLTVVEGVWAAAEPVPGNTTPQ